MAGSATATAVLQFRVLMQECINPVLSKHYACRDHVDHGFWSAISTIGETTPSLTTINSLFESAYRRMIQDRRRHEAVTPEPWEALGKAIFAFVWNAGPMTCWDVIGGIVAGMGRPLNGASHTHAFLMGLHRDSAGFSSTDPPPDPYESGVERGYHEEPAGPSIAFEWEQEVEETVPLMVPPMDPHDDMDVLGGNNPFFNEPPSVGFVDWST